MIEPTPNCHCVAMPDCQPKAFCFQFHWAILVAHRLQNKQASASCHVAPTWWASDLISGLKQRVDSAI